MRCVDLVNYVTSEGTAVKHPAVVIPLVTQHWSMLRRNLVYTAVTRGKRLVVLVGRRRTTFAGRFRHRGPEPAADRPAKAA